MKLKKESKLAILFAVSIALWLASLWQLEILTIWMRSGKDVFEFPFFVFTTNLWVARDFWYLVNGISVVLPLLYILKEKSD